MMFMILFLYKYYELYAFVYYVGNYYFLVWFF